MKQATRTAVSVWLAKIAAMIILCSHQTRRLQIKKYRN
nr:MAG TPA: hypothetical protein [Caudoviricetes sp.]